MEEELVVLDEELCRIIKEVEKDYAAVTKVGTKLKRNQRENKIEDMLDKLQTGRGTYSLYHGQLKELVHEGNSSCVTKFKDKGHQYNQTLQKLAKQVKLAKDQLAKEPLLPGDRDRKDMNTWGADEIIEEGARVQDASKSSLARSQRLVESAEALGLETNEELHKQSDTIKDTTAQVAALSAGLDRADRILMHIARRLATDKMILCLVLLLVLAILALIIAKGLGVLPGDGGSDQTEIDCSLDFTRTTSECVAAREAAASGNRRSNLKLRSLALHGPDSGSYPGRGPDVQLGFWARDDGASGFQVVGDLTPLRLRTVGELKRTGER